MGRGLSRLCESRGRGKLPLDASYLRSIVSVHSSFVGTDSHECALYELNKINMDAALSVIKVHRGGGDCAAAVDALGALQASLPTLVVPESAVVVTAVLGERGQARGVTSPAAHTMHTRHACATHTPPHLTTHTYTMRMPGARRLLLCRRAPRPRRATLRLRTGRGGGVAAEECILSLLWHAHADSHHVKQPTALARPLRAR